MTPEAALREALTVALTVALHETFDPECSGEPPYDSSQRLAAEIMAKPVIVSALATPSPTATRDLPPKPERWGAPAMTETEMRAAWGDR